MSLSFLRPATVHCSIVMSDGKRYYATVPENFLNMLRAVKDHYGGSWTLNQAIIMVHVSLDELAGHPCTAADIARTEGMTQQAVSHGLHALREAGIVTESVDPEDHRRRLLVTTDKYQRVRTRLAEDVVGFHDGPTAS